MSKNLKEIIEIVDTLLRLGWTVKKNKKNHYWCVPPDIRKTPLLIAGSPKTDRSLKTTKVRLRNEYGVDIEKIKL